MEESEFLVTFQQQLNSCMESLLKRTTAEIITLVKCRFSQFFKDIVTREAENRRLSAKLQILEKQCKQPDVNELLKAFEESGKCEKLSKMEQEASYMLDFQTHLNSCMDYIIKQTATEIATWVKGNVAKSDIKAKSNEVRLSNNQQLSANIATDNFDSATRPIAYEHSIEFEEVEHRISDAGLEQGTAPVESRHVPEAACFVVAEPSLDYELMVATAAIEDHPHATRSSRQGEQKVRAALEDAGPNGHSYPGVWEVAEGSLAQAGEPLDAGQALELDSSPPEIIALHGCSRCGKNFSKEWILRRHMRKHGDGAGLGSEVTGHMCPHCSRGFKHRKGLVSHLHSHSGEKPYSCDICNQRFTRPESVNKHRRLHSGVKPYSCSQCPRRFFRSDGLKSHMLTHEGKRRPKSQASPKLCMCAHCGKAFSNATQVANHERTHTGEKPFECPQCHKRFRHAGALSVHRITHQRERPHACPQCPKTFRCTKHLKRHLLTHSDIRPFSCDQCPLAFRTANELKGHKVRHGLQRIHACPDCGKNFKTEYEVKLHRRAHNGERPYSCPDCDRTFRRLHHLSSHRLTHTGEKPYACDVCQRRFIRAREMRSHKKKVHLAIEPSKCDQCQETFMDLEAHKRIFHAAVEGLDQNIQGLCKFPRILPRHMAVDRAQGNSVNQTVQLGRAVYPGVQPGGKALGPVVFVLAGQGVPLPVLQPRAVLTPMTTVVKVPLTPGSATLKLPIAAMPSTRAADKAPAKTVAKSKTRSSAKRPASHPPGEPGTTEAPSKARANGRLSAKCPAPAPPVTAVTTTMMAKAPVRTAGKANTRSTSKTSASPEATTAKPLQTPSSSPTV